MRYVVIVRINFYLTVKCIVHLSIFIYLMYIYTNLSEIELFGCLVDYAVIQYFVL